MMKVVLKLDILDERVKQKAMKNVSSLPGVDSIAVDMKDKKLTVTGDVDPVTVVSKLRKICDTDIVSVGPAKEPEKKKEDDKKKADEKKKEDDKKKAAAAVYTHNLPYAYYNYQQQQQPYYQYNHLPTQYDSYKVVHDETPYCVIC